MVLGLLLHLSPPKENLTKSLCGEVVRTWQCEPFRSFNTYKIYCLFVCTFCVCVVCVHFSLPVHVPMLVQRTLGSISSTLFQNKTRPLPHPISWFGSWEASAVLSLSGSTALTSVCASMPGFVDGC